MKHITTSISKGKSEEEMLEAVTEWLRREKEEADLVLNFPWYPLGYNELNFWRIGGDGKPEAESMSTVVTDDGRHITPEDAEWDDIDHDNYAVFHWDDLTDGEKRGIYEIAIAYS